MRQPYRLMVIGAHPDDCEFVAGIALKYIALGHKVKFLTATNGCSGHQTQMGGSISQRRKQEAAAVAARAGLEYEIFDIDDGSLQSGLHERNMMLHAIRSFAPDVIITHRPNDYHPDHRATSMLVQDCSYLVQVPNLCPMTPVLRYQPAIFYMPDSFQKPQPFSPDLVFDISDVYEEKLRLFHLYTSQMYEWLPWVDGILDQVPENDEARFAFLRNTWGPGFDAWAVRWQGNLQAKYATAQTIAHAEALEICEYGGRLSGEQLKACFPF